MSVGNVGTAFDNVLSCSTEWSAAPEWAEILVFRKQFGILTRQWYITINNVLKRKTVLIYEKDN